MPSSAPLRARRTAISPPGRAKRSQTRSHGRCSQHVGDRLSHAEHGQGTPRARRQLQNQINKTRQQRYLVKRVQSLGLKVNLDPAPSAAQWASSKEPRVEGCETLRQKSASSFRVAEGRGAVVIEAGSCSCGCPVESFREIASRTANGVDCLQTRSRGKLSFSRAHFCKILSTPVALVILAISGTGCSTQVAK